MSETKRNKTSRRPVSLPHFDPNPSAKFGLELLTELGVPHALIGRVAMWALMPNEPQEYTKDVDFAVPLRAAELLKAALARRGIVARPISIGGWAVREGDIRVDFIDRRVGELNRLFEEAIDEAERHGQRAEVGGNELPVVPAEYLVALKVVAAERRDRHDAVRLIKAIKELDLHRTREIIQRHGGPGAANLLDSLARDAGHADARPEYRNSG